MSVGEKMSKLNKNQIRKEDLELLSYSEESPTGLVWKNDRYSARGRILVCKQGSVAGGLKGLNAKYFRVKVNGRDYLCHRLVWSMFNDIDPTLEIDHIDRNPLNNSIKNLRECSSAINCRNTKIRKHKTYLNVGVCIKLDKNNIPAFMAHWTQDGVLKTKCFSVRKYGLIPAQKLAVDYRNKMIAELNAKGHEYSEQHGKD